MLTTLALPSILSSAAVHSRQASDYRLTPKSKLTQPAALAKFQKTRTAEKENKALLGRFLSPAPTTAISQYVVYTDTYYNPEDSTKLPTHVSNILICFIYEVSNYLYLDRST